tara:strand:- start:1676 stop:3607 length:1932 start_codon:yes stop_codon:yes gene_type:complete
MNEFSSSILSLPRYSKITIALITDIALCIFCTWLAVVLRLEELILFKEFNFLPALLSVILAIPIFWLLGLYKTVFRYTDLSILFNVLISIIIYGFIFFLIISVYSFSGVSRIIGILQPILLFFGIISSRLFARKLLSQKNNYNKTIKKNIIAIFGAGFAGRQLAISLENNPRYKIIAFLDDNIDLQKKTILGKTVYAPSNINYLIENKHLDSVFLAIPSVSRDKRNQIIKKLNIYPIKVKTLPSMSEIIDGRVTISDIKELNMNDLLNRDEVRPNLNLLNKNIKSKVVLVTGAGGSIGSELCRQIIKLKPKKLILLELNEYSLYKIHEELLNNYSSHLIIPLLANVQDQNKNEIIFETFNVNTVYHAAAYKHVPLVEENICEGVQNNVFSTLAIINASIVKKVSNLVVISSDKAVRPSNIMGASKRLSEICMQAIYKQHEDLAINFSIVRFGNVIESSGSAIPKFKKQIKEGGPVTLTHQEVTRYFMTVTEAAQLVIQAGALGKKSEVFVLDMGKSIKIFNLIQRMISLSGLELKDNRNPNGDIEIKITGLKPGEKLYEELLIGNDPEKTEHPKILKINEPSIPFNELEKKLNYLKILLIKNDVQGVKKVLENLINSFHFKSKMVDRIHIEQKSNKSYENYLH